MNKKKRSGILLVTGGVIELILGTIHFIWPFNFIQLTDFRILTSPVKDFILLAFLSLGLCMTIFAFLSFYFSKRIILEEKSALIFCLSQGLLWIFRLIFEILLPVRVPLFSIKNPSNMIIIMAILVILIYLAPVFLLNKRINTVK